MKQEKKIAEFWRKEYSRNIKRYSAFHVSDHFRQIAALFSPGISYFYVLNVHNLELDFISPEVEDFIGIPSEEATIEKLLGAALPQELEWVEKKEKVVKDFFQNFMRNRDASRYKLVYTYMMKDPENKTRVILHQANPITTTEDGAIQHVLSIHSDISHITSRSTRTVSFVDLTGKQSFFNVKSKNEVFTPDLANSGPTDIFQKLSKREKEILDLIAKGYGARKIAELLNVSVHTVQTHRKNILKKSGCRNTAELVAEGMVAGLVHV